MPGTQRQRQSSSHQPNSGPKRLSQPAQAAESYNQSVTYYVINGNAIYFIGFDVEFFGITFFSFALGVSAVCRWCGIDAEGQKAREIYFIYRQRSMGCGPCFSKCLNGQSVLRETQHLQLLYKWFLWCIILHGLLYVAVCVLCVSYLFFCFFLFSSNKFFYVIIWENTVRQVGWVVVEQRVLWPCALALRKGNVRTENRNEEE